MDKKNLLNELDRYLGTELSLNEIYSELKNHYICELTEYNSNVIEDGIRNDPNYEDKMSPIITNLGIYQNGSNDAVIMERLFNGDVLERFVWQVAISNSIQGKTHEAKNSIADFIRSNGFSFFEKLREGNKALVQDMDKHVYISSGKKRHECSWCSKVCKYLHEYLYNTDAYYIYDNNVKEKLNDYRGYYGLSKILNRDIKVIVEPSRDNNDIVVNNWYENFWNALEDLREGTGLNRTQLDHIMWGFAKYKVELVRV